MTQFTAGNVERSAETSLWANCTPPRRMRNDGVTVDSVSGTAHRPSGTEWSLTHCSWQSERYRLNCCSFRHRATGPAVWVPTTGVAREVASWEAVLKPPPVHTTLPVPRCPVHRVKHLTWAWAGFLPGEFCPLWRVSPAAGGMRRETGEMFQRGLAQAEVVRW